MTIEISFQTKPEWKHWNEGYEIFLSVRIQECLEKLSSEVQRIFLETQKDFFEQKRDLYFCILKTNRRSDKLHSMFVFPFKKKQDDL
ncbi:hypothetical protein HMPREF0204_12938 [Chryseobacterium gleum ATCC 35910]|uniref:Uncharacterized protein n=1 Tax=Chryseobacterium gleum ATCC 35910 TaxID=525257 RepID=A0ABP2IQU2_CHRGE|nr:hypothetical protein CEQ15_09255 [Chryseobacterium indologenes]EFK33869.1 hypothetical protein HMPREF0204_12938 [Chryseobacterium gleum ATCC 35910]